VSRWVALIRGINVGRAKRVAMADLRDLFEQQRFNGVRTLLNSGNVVFDAPRGSAKRLAQKIESAFEQRFGFAARVTVLAAGDLAQIVAANPLRALARDDAKHLVAFAADRKILAALQPLLEERWVPDALALTEAAAYLWCAAGVLDSELAAAFAKRAGEGVTTRNWATVQKLLAACEA
jgi:uncharacterized protein (DUF1697 family)